MPEQPAFDAESAFGAAHVPAEALGRDHAVTRDHDGEGVRPAGARDGAWPTVRESRQLAVGDDASGRDRLEQAPDPFLKRGSPSAELQGKAVTGIVEIAIEFLADRVRGGIAPRSIVVIGQKTDRSKPSTAQPYAEDTERLLREIVLTTSASSV